MAATKKQVGELENAIVILEERLEKLEEEHTMMKQMLNMQNSLIENLQMMVKMMSPIIITGGASMQKNQKEEDKNTNEVVKEEQQISSSSYQKISLDNRMRRVI